MVAHVRTHIALEKRYRSFLIALSMAALLLSVESGYGSAYFPLPFQPSTTVNSPPVLLQNGTAGSRVIYANNTSAKVSAVAPRNWLSSWEKRVKITIDKSDVAGTLSSFPVLIHLSSSSGMYGDDVRFVFDDLLNDANRKKIAITTSDGTTQCYAEIEKWDTANKQAWLWTKAPSLSNTVNTVLYLYYDRNQADNTNYVGDTGSTAAQNVWDSSFKGVWHLSETTGGSGAIKDSTSNKNNGTNYGSPALGSTGQIDGAVDFDGTDDYIGIPNSGSLQFTSSLTIEAWINLDSFGSGSDVDVILRKGEANPNDYQLAVYNQTLSLKIEENDDQGLNSASTIPANTWYYVTGTWNGTTRKVYLNSSESGSGSKTGNIVPDTRAIYIGGRSGADLSDGTIDEVRASNTTRDVSWTKATYESGRDHLADFGTEELRSYYPANYNILSGNWRDLSWGYRKRIAVNHAQVQANLTAFPVLINLASDADLASHAQSNGNDILFTGSNGVTKLCHEIEKYNSTNGALVAWVKVPSLSSSVDTDLYMYYGNPTCGSQQDAINVWDGNFKGVWHLKENPSGTAPQMKDSTSNGNNGTSSGSMTTSDQVAGKIDGSLDFDGSNDEITCGNAASLQITTEITIEAWASTSSTGASRSIVGKHNGNSPYPGYQLRKYSDDYYRFMTDGTGQYIASDSAYTDSGWHYIVGVRRNGINYLYIDGAQQTATSAYAITESGVNFDIGRGYSNYNGFWWLGYIDEVRVSNSGRNASWIGTCYNNQNSPSSFYSVGTQEGNPKVSGTVPASVQTLDSDYFVIRSTGSATSTTAYNPSGYNLVGSTTLVSGTTSDLVSNNGAYMTFSSYASATSLQPLYAHQETTTIGGTSYYLLNVSSANAAGTTLSASAGSTGRKLMGKFVYQLTGVSSIAASTWTMYYRAYRSSFSVAAHGDIDILVRMSNGTVRTTRATHVANSGAIGTSWGTVSGTHSWSAYTVVDQTDYLEIDYYIEVTTSAFGASVYLRIDDSSLATTSQTRATNVYLPSEYTSEVEFTSSSNTQPWYQFVRTVDSAWTAGSVTVTIQIYNYTSGGYPTSGNGYDSYTSTATPNTDETRTHTIITNPTSFRNATGYWKIKVKGVKTTTTQFDFKADWLKLEPSHYSEYTASTEFLFSGMTRNTPTQLNFTVVSEYDSASVSVTIQIWNYSSSAYVTSGQGYLTYSSSGTNETRLLSVNTNPQLYTSDGNAKIKITGLKTVTTQYQQRTNQVKLVYNYSSSPTYNYVLKIVNQVSDTWKIRLRAYSQSNIARLSNCTLFFRNSTDGTSRQIYIENGAYVNQTGSWYDLPATPAERYIVVTLLASNSEVTYLYAYLEILVPNKTTYVRYVVTLEIT